MNGSVRRLVVLAGGTGASTLYSGAKHHNNMHITAVCTPCDNGGHTGVLRDEYGLALPHGDLRQALVALMPGEESEFWREVFQVRFENSGGADSSCGNFVVGAAEMRYGPIEGIRKLTKALNVPHDVFPTSASPAMLCAELDDGHEICGETLIDTRGKNHADDTRSIRRIYLRSPVSILLDTAQAIKAASLLCLGPGDLFTSVLPHFCVTGIKEAFASAHAPVVVPINLMTKHGETHDFTAATCAKVLLEHGIGRRRIDVALVNTGSIPEGIAQAYAQKERSMPMRYDEQVKGELAQYADRIIECNLLSPKGLQAGIIRHDSTTLAQQVVNLLEQA